jgi:aminopeptidase
MITSKRIRSQTHKRNLPSSFRTQLQYSRYARKIIHDVLHLKAGENLTIEAWEHELPFAKEIKFQARKLGANVLLHLEDDENYFRLIDSGAGNNLGNVGNHEWSLLENSDAYVFFPGPADAQRQANLDSNKRAKAQAYNQTWYSRASKAGVRGARIRTSYVTRSRANMLGFDFRNWYEDTLDAIDVDYQKIDKIGRKLSAYFKRGSEVRIRAPGQTNLRMRVDDVTPHLYSGILSKPIKNSIFTAMLSIPGNELDVVPNASSVNGTVFYDRPVFSDGKRIEGLRWTFKDGRLVKYSARRNLQLFSKPYKEAKGDKDKVGVVIIGLNPKLRYGFNHDFHVAGSLTIGIGANYEGDKNKTDYQFNATLSKATVSVNDNKILERGRIIVK